MRIELMTAAAVALLCVPNALATVPPTPPENLDFFWADGDSIVLSWDPPSAPVGAALDHYIVYQLHNGEDLPPEDVPPTTPKNTFQIDGIEWPGVYVFYVEAVNADGLRSPPSTPILLALDYPHCMVVLVDLNPVGATPHPNCLLPPP